MALSPESPLQIHEGRVFRDFADLGLGRTFADAEFRDCMFQHCSISATLNPNRRSTVRRVSLYGCKTAGCAVYPAILEDVRIEDLDTLEPLRTFGAVFKRTVITGRIGRVQIGQRLVQGDVRQQAAFDQANDLYYRYTPWALDISGVEAEQLVVFGIPGALVRRDTKTQAVVSALGAIRGEWRSIDMPLDWKALLEEAAVLRGPDLILVAPKLSPEFDRYASVLDELRARKVAAPF